MPPETIKTSYAFGRHASFQLRYGWLTKGYAALGTADENLFLSEDATTKLGVGKNMVASIRYWLRATGVADKDDKPSDFGRLLFSNKGHDRYLEDEATLWLIHWQLATNQKLASSVYWLFNHFHKTSFSADEAFNELVAFLSERNALISENTVRNDLQVILRMYAPHRTSDTHLEDMLESPLSMLELIRYSNRRYNCRPAKRETLPPEVIGYAIEQHFSQSDNKPVPVKDLMYGNHKPLGAIFRLTEEALIAKLERLIRLWPKNYELREDAGVHQLYKTGKSTVTGWLNKYYEKR